MNEYWALVEWYWQWKTKVLGEEPSPMPLRPPQIRRRVAWHWTQSSTMRGRPLTTWALAWPFHLFVDNHSLSSFRTLHCMKWYDVHKWLIMHVTLVLLRQTFSRSKLRVTCPEVCYFYINPIFFRVTSRYPVETNRSAERFRPSSLNDIIFKETTPDSTLWHSLMCLPIFLNVKSLQKFYCFLLTHFACKVPKKYERLLLLWLLLHS